MSSTSLRQITSAKKFYFQQLGTLTGSGTDDRKSSPADVTILPSSFAHRHSLLWLIIRTSSVIFKTSIHPSSFMWLCSFWFCCKLPSLFFYSVGFSGHQISGLVSWSDAKHRKASPQLRSRQHWKQRNTDFVYLCICVPSVNTRHWSIMQCGWQVHCLDCIAPCDILIVFTLVQQHGQPSHPWWQGWCFTGLIISADPVI
jgi:hypothetical protein